MVRWDVSLCNKAESACGSWRYVLSSLLQCNDTLRVPGQDPNYWAVHYGRGTALLIISVHNALGCESKMEASIVRHRGEFPYNTPVEIMQEILDWVVYDDRLLDHAPSWKHWATNSTSRSHRDSEAPDSYLDPWSRTSDATFQTIKSISTVSKAFRCLSMRYVFQQVCLSHSRDVQRFLDVIDPKVSRWTLRVSLPIEKETVWTRADTATLCRLFERCPNLRICSVEIMAPGEDHNAGELVLQQLVACCKRLQRLHWQPLECMGMSPKKWTELLRLSPQLLALDIDSPPFIPSSSSESPFDQHLPPLLLPNLRALQIGVDLRHFTLASEAKSWSLPALQSLHLTSNSSYISEAVGDLFSAHGQTLLSLTLDANTSEIGPYQGLSIPETLRLCGDNIQEFVFTACVKNTLPSTSRAPVTKTKLATLVMVVEVFSYIDNTWKSPFGNMITIALDEQYEVVKACLPALKQLVVVHPGLVEEPTGVEVVTSLETLWRGRFLLKKYSALGVQVVSRCGQPLQFELKPF